MAEPHASAASAAAGSAFGIGLVAGFVNPVMQHWALLAVGAVGGAILAVQVAKTPGLRHASAVFLRAIIIAGLMSGACATIAAPYLGASTDVLLMPVACLIAWHHERIGPLFGQALALLSKFTKPGAK